jgi:hypothetical protein
MTAAIGIEAIVNLGTLHLGGSLCRCRDPGLRSRVKSGESRLRLAREYGIGQDSIYEYLRLSRAEQ